MPELHQLYSDAIHEFISEYKAKQKLLYGRNLKHNIKISKNNEPTYIYFESGADYYMHFEIKSFEDWCKEGGLL